MGDAPAAGDGDAGLIPLGELRLDSVAALLSSVALPPALPDLLGSLGYETVDDLVRGAHDDAFAERLGGQVPHHIARLNPCQRRLRQRTTTP